MPKRILFIILLNILFITCNETLPPRELPENIIDAYTYSGATRYAVCSSNSRPFEPYEFNIAFQNMFDETLQNYKYISVELYVSCAYWPEERSVITYIDTSSTDMITIDPHEIYHLKVDWDHKNIDNKYIYQSITPRPNITKSGYEIKFKVSGKIQLFKNLEPVNIKERDFKIIYFLDEHC